MNKIKSKDRVFKGGVIGEPWFPIKNKKAVNKKSIEIKKN